MDHSDRQAVEIRPLRPDDRDGFVRLMTQFYEHAGNDVPPRGDIERLFHKAVDPHTNLSYLLACVGERAVGLLSLTFGESSYKVAPFAWCDDFYVEEEHRRLGVGARLVQAAALAAAEQGCSNILLGIGREEPSAQDFYGKNGFIDLNCKLLSLPIDRQPAQNFLPKHRHTALDPRP